MICRFCGSEVPDPPIIQAQAAGFQVGEHCHLVAARDGRVIPCCQWAGYSFCESCPVGMRFGMKVEKRTVKA